MRRALPALLIAAATACSSEAPLKAEKPAAATAQSQPPAIQTTSIAAAQPPPAQPAPPGTSQPAMLEAPALAASLMPEQIEKTFSHHRRYFHRLYVERVKARPKLKGTMLVSFVVHPDGSATDAKLAESTLGDPTFEKEILKQIGETHFPPASGATPVDRYPLEFSLRPK